MLHHTLNSHSSIKRIYEQTFYSPGTYDLTTTPDKSGKKLPARLPAGGFKIVQLKIVGGGGGGGGGADGWSGSGFGSGGGGGGSGYYQEVSNVKIFSTNISAIIGSGGAGGPLSTQEQDPGPEHNGQPGTPSYLSVSGNTLYYCSPGSGGYTGHSRNPEPYPYQGAGGSGWQSGEGGEYGQSAGGKGGDSFYAAGGPTIPGGSGNGIAGSLGSGGSGGAGCGWSPSGRGNGGNGGSGMIYIKIEYYL